nr:DUF3039 domain-containing protein [Cellulomonas sp. URHE0023]
MPSAPDDPSGPDQGTSTSVLEREETREQVEPGDHERFAHYVRKEKITESAVSGKPVIALCGKVWVPGRDPNKFPVCPVCKEIYEGLREPQDGDKGGEGGSSGGRKWGFGRNPSGGSGGSGSGGDASYTGTHGTTNGGS